MKCNKNSVSPPHWPHLKCSIATCGWWLWYQTSQIVENFHYGRKCFWRWSRLLCALHTHIHTPRGITGTLQWSYEEGHPTPRDLVESLPDTNGSLLLMEGRRGCKGNKRACLPLPTSNPLRGQSARRHPTATMLDGISFLSQITSLPWYSHYSILSIYKGKLPCLTW